MVIGDGLIANSLMSVFKDDDKFVVFAAGVSDSTETNSKNFKKEKAILNDILIKNKDKILIYFSTVSLFDLENISDYILHKTDIEDNLTNSGNKFIIFRLPQVIGRGGNKKNIINTIVDRVKNNEILTIWDNAYRNIIDVDDVARIVKYFSKNSNSENKVFNIFGPENKKIIDIVLIVEKILNKEAKKEIIERESFFFKKNNKDVNDAFSFLGINKLDYTEKIIKKYIK